MKKENKITLSKETKDAMIAEIKKYFQKERGEELGDLAAALILDFIVEKLAPDFYNQGVSDSYTYTKEMIEDLLAIQK
jgi:uncharacterized protein (DUF2164 family)